ncbi:Protein O-GlcNAcase [Geodia barretti]|uniref:Protein O-GlcNAcase n=1 Tax=Geodia barretti TaxID=519541 RepID=A0AA35SER5_GEOBA|nr:Protein O-GlcNAcase [Geodia barretti]
MEVHLYEPVKALELAMKEWLGEFVKTVAQPDHYLPVKNASSIAKANECEELGPIDHDDIGQRDDPDSKQVDPEMDPKLLESGSAMLVSEDPFCYEDLRLLVDFFYLHQHGEMAMRVLEEFCWLKENSPGYDALRGMGKLKGRDGGGGEEVGGRGGGVSCDRVSEDGMRSDGETSDRNEEDPISPQEVTEWCERCQSFHLLCQMVKDMYSRLTTIPNRPLLYDVYQYMWDAKETTTLLDSYISWLGRCTCLLLQSVVGTSSIQSKAALFFQTSSCLLSWYTST